MGRNLGQRRMTNATNEGGIVNCMIIYSLQKPVVVLFCLIWSAWSACAVLCAVLCCSPARESWHTSAAGPGRVGRPVELEGTPLRRSTTARARFPVQAGALLDGRVHDADEMR